ncbi:MAG: hypothetical protein RAO92_04105 [Candidatus Euphemobacter frigidus]|nr:hypothetical protein [Candidatus Euphemobacter frigidus]MDP8275568.1 hypothetical protein [Candidatus Euphemobacter frigidus]
MKTVPGGWAVVVFFLITLFILPISNDARGASRSVTEHVVLPTEPGGGSGGYFPPGTGVFGKTKFQLTGSGGCYSYNPTVYPIPPSSISNMGPGHCGSNEQIYLSGSVTVSGHVNVSQSIMDEVQGGDLTHLQAGWSCGVGNKLPIGTTGEEGDDREFAGPRNTFPLQGWWPPEGTYNSGTPCWPYDPGYAAFPVIDPQWDKDNDGDTDTTDYDYYVQHGGFAAENGGPTGEISYTQKDDPTICVMDKGVLIPASEGQAWYDDYYIDENHNFVGTWKEVYFTGDQYRFNNFESGASQSYHYTGNMAFYCDNFHHGGSNDMLLDPNASIVMAVKNSIVFDGASNFNVGGSSNQFDVVCTGPTIDIGGSANGTAGSFYAPNADMVIEGAGWIYAAIIANSVEIGGSRSICYPLNYQGPNGGAGGGGGGGDGGDGGTPVNPPSREDWKEIIVSD